ncbi:MAG: EamA family transporter [Caldilineaceae bacterium]|nr:EamA family transporter [Caldilineaceae bacterium]
MLSRIGGSGRVASARHVAIAQALLVTFLWSTSWVLIKFGLGEIPALTFAGLRYTLAFGCLLPFALRPAHRAALAGLSRREWGNLALLGVLFYALTQGAQFLALSLLPAITTSLLLNFTTVVVALIGAAFMAEKPHRLQWVGIVLNLAGVLLYFFPVALPAGQWVGIAVALTGVLANALGALLGRQVNRGHTLSPLLVTVVSMGIGGLLLLVAGIVTQGLPALSPAHWLTVGWLAVVNTAYAFTLWNRTLRQLSAVESSMINSTMLIQITLLAWFILGERLTGQEMAGLALAALGVGLVQWRPAVRKP